MKVIFVHNYLFLPHLVHPLVENVLIPSSQFSLAVRATRNVKSNGFHKESSLNILTNLFHLKKICLQRLMWDFMSFQLRYQEGSALTPHLAENKKGSKLHIIIRRRSVIVHLHFTRAFPGVSLAYQKVSIIIGISGISPQMGYLFWDRGLLSNHIYLGGN